LVTVWLFNARIRAIARTRSRVARKFAVRLTSRDDPSSAPAPARERDAFFVQSRAQAKKFVHFLRAAFVEKQATE
jgi:hypothetical protein